MRACAWGFVSWPRSGVMDGVYMERFMECGMVGLVWYGMGYNLYRRGGLYVTMLRHGLVSCLVVGYNYILEKTADIQTSRERENYSTVLSTTNRRLTPGHEPGCLYISR